MASVTTMLASIMVLLLWAPWTYVLLLMLIIGVVATGALAGVASKSGDRYGSRF